MRNCDNLLHTAAFRRLCVETTYRQSPCRLPPQPPLGGCVLKPNALPWLLSNGVDQPPLGGCVLKPSYCHSIGLPYQQPPLGGCVLKLLLVFLFYRFLRLQPPLGGCVLKRWKVMRCRRRMRSRL